jgi:hypothetical protein
MHKNVVGKDLIRKHPSLRIRVGGYAILGRTIDKCRALVAGNIGEYHFDCPLDNMLFGFKGVNGADFKAQIENGASDQQMAEWLDQTGEKKTPEETRRWSDEVEASRPYDNPEKREWFVEQTQPLDSIPKLLCSVGWRSTTRPATKALSPE